MTAPRLAAAPISWGVCEVPGWGHVLPVETVLGEMAALGLRATELGPPGFLPDQPDTLRAGLAAHDLSLVGSFLALVLHDPAVRDATLAEAERACRLLAGAAGQVLVIAASTGLDGYDTRLELDDAGWAHLLDTLTAITGVAAEHGLIAALHPHVGTHIETAAEVGRFLASSSLPLCLDTGHLLIGGTDPVVLARAYGDRIAHVHLKDVDAPVAARVQSGEISYQQAVGMGLYRPLGQGDVAVGEVIQALTAAGYDGWWVLEQDTALPQNPEAKRPGGARPPTLAGVSQQASGLEYDDKDYEDPLQQPRRDTAASIAFFRAATSPDTNK